MLQITLSIPMKQTVYIESNTPDGVTEIKLAFMLPRLSPCWDVKPSPLSVNGSTEFVVGNYCL